MKVLFLTNIPSPYRIDFFNEWGKRCDLTVWFEAPSESNRSWEIAGLGRHFRCKFLKGRTFGLDKHLNLSIVRELQAEPFDVYILGCYSSPTEMIAIHWLKLRGKPFVLNSDGGFPGRDRWLRRKLKTYLIGSAGLWLSSGSQCTRYLRHYGADASRIREYPLASTVLSEQDLQPLSARERAILKRKDNLQEVVVLAVGQFVPRKGFDLLLRAFARLRRERRDMAVSLLLVGGGPDRALYESIIREEGIRHVTIRNFMQRDDLLPYWKIADLFVLPTRYDVWGLVVNEAAAFGLPIVTTEMAGAAADLVREGENGFVVKPDDEEALARRIGQLAQDRALRERCGRRSRELAALYAMDRMVERHQQILQAWQDGGEGVSRDPSRQQSNIAQRSSCRVKKTAGTRILFVCTKPYQYLIARLIKEGCGFGACDLVILNHFFEAAAFARKVEETGVWRNVMYIDDDELDQYKLALHPLRKFFFYHRWQDKLPPELADTSAYAQVFVAHDFVAVEYAVMRKFGRERKPVYLYEEGFGNYINNSTHASWHMRLLKRMAPLFGLPGGYFGSLKWIDSVWLQRPRLVTADRRNPLRNKTRGLPLAFSQFLAIPQIVGECYRLYPELHEIDRQVADCGAMSVVLTDTFLDAVPDRPRYIRDMQIKVREAVGDRDMPLFIKQHPGEKLSVEDHRVTVLPKKLPSELLYLVMLRNNIRKIHLFSFGSTSILNLYDLCQSSGMLDIYIFDSLQMDGDIRLIASRFCELADRHRIAYRIV